VPEEFHGGRRGAECHAAFAWPYSAATQAVVDIGHAAIPPEELAVRRGDRVEATDGHIGKVDESSNLVGEQYLVVDTGPWIFGKKVLLPAGTVNHVDPLDQKVYVDRTKAQIKDAPEFHPDTYNSQEYRSKVGDYYRDTYGDPT
jgi:hypothetical protein